MSGDYAIKIAGLGKQYVIGGAPGHYSYRSLREGLANALMAPVRKFRQLDGSVSEENKFWALRDVDLEIQKGEILGVIGPNGAGKSTLLKILSKITEPTTGCVRIRGRVGSLLEVGTGFHPELTGRENIFLNGTILGMRSSEIKEKLDEIIEFAGVEKFLHTPVKRYSSGMYVRLAFAVAAHLETEIMLVDEVLAVGDLEFQRKCLGKMQDVAGSGRTVLFVSHNMAAIESLCSSCVIIENGRMSEPLLPAKAVSRYANMYEASAPVSLEGRKDRRGKGDFRVKDVEICNYKGQPMKALPVGEPLVIRIRYQGNRHCRLGRAVVGIYDQMQVGILRFDSRLSGDTLNFDQGEGVLECITEPIAAVPGNYFLNIALFEANDLQDHVQRACNLTLVSSDFFGNGQFVTESDVSLMKVLIRHEWKSR